MFEKKNIHFVGIGGIGMSARVAAILKKRDLKFLEVMYRTIL